MQQRLERPPLSPGWSSASIPSATTPTPPLAENLLFGTPVGDTFDLENLAEQPYVRQMLDETGLTDNAGRRSATSWPPPWSRSSPTCRPTTSISASSASSTPRSCRATGRCSTASTRASSDQLGPGRPAAPHGAAVQADPGAPSPRSGRGRSARQGPRRPPGVPRAACRRSLRRAVAFFDPDRYNDAASIQDNILFGKIAYGQAQAEERIADADHRGARGAAACVERVIEVGLAVAGRQRRCAALCRSGRSWRWPGRLLKRPEVFVLDDPLARFDPARADAGPRRAARLLCRQERLLGAAEPEHGRAASTMCW